MYIRTSDPTILNLSMVKRKDEFSIVGSLAQPSTGCLKMNGALSKVNKKFISHLTRAKRTPSASASATVQVSHALPAVRFS